MLYISHLKMSIVVFISQTLSHSTNIQNIVWIYTHKMVDVSIENDLWQPPNCVINIRLNTDLYCIIKMRVDTFLVGFLAVFFSSFFFLHTSWRIYVKWACVQCLTFHFKCTFDFELQVIFEFYLWRDWSGTFNDRKNWNEPFETEFLYLEEEK